jgi:hypothetical protein
LSIPDFTDNLSKDTRYFPTLIAALIFLIFLLFFDKLNDPLKLWFVPSLAVYVLGTSFIGYLQTMLNIRKQATLSINEFRMIMALHSVWFACLIEYNLYRGSI